MSDYRPQRPFDCGVVSVSNSADTGRSALERFEWQLLVQSNAYYRRSGGEEVYRPALPDVQQTHITCPIGVPGIAGKEPEVIALSVIAQLLEPAG